LITELGGRVYERHEQSEDAMADRKIQSLLKRIKLLEKKIGRLENAGRIAGKKGPRNNRDAGVKRIFKRKEKS